MKNFEFYNPVKILFGKGKVDKLATAIPAGAKVLMIYGGGSIKKNGVYEQVTSALKGFEWYEFSGVEANPTYEKSMEALKVVKDKKIDFLLAVGGGSVIDATKFVAAAALYNGDDPWEILKGARVNQALPLGVVLTLPATGSEMNGNAVISRKSLQEKLAFGSKAVMPKFSVLDPEHTYSLPKRQVANGIVDAFVHVMEQYLTYPVNTPVQDRMAEGILLSLIEEGRKAFSTDQPDYENRANLMWAATMALNGIISVGVQECWATHQIGHELTAFHGLDHALTLSIVLPGLLRIKMEERSAKLLQYGERVWHITEGSETERMEKAIQATESFFREMGMLTKLSEHNLGRRTIDEITSRFLQRKFITIGEQQDITILEIEQILVTQMQ